MWLSELVGRLNQQLKENGDMRVVSKVRGFHSSKFEDNYVYVNSQSFRVDEFCVTDENGKTISSRKQMEIDL